MCWQEHQDGDGHRLQARAEAAPLALQCWARAKWVRKVFEALEKSGMALQLAGRSRKGARRRTRAESLM